MYFDKTINLDIVDNYKDVLIIVFYKNNVIDLKYNIMKYLTNSDDKLYHYNKNYYDNLNQLISGSYCLRFDILFESNYGLCMQCKYTPLFIQDNYCKHCDISYTKDDYFQHHYCLNCNECKAVPCIKCDNCDLCHEFNETYYYCKDCNKCFTTKHLYRCRDCGKCQTAVSEKLHNCCNICNQEYFTFKIHCDYCNTCDFDFHYYCKICKVCSLDRHFNCKTIEYSKCQLCDYKDFVEYTDQDHYTCEDCNKCFTSHYCNKCKTCNNCYGGGYCTFCYISSLQNNLNYDCSICNQILLVDPRSTNKNRIDKYLKRISRKIKKTKSYCFPYKQINK